MPLHSTPFPRVSTLDNSDGTKFLEQLRDEEHTTRGIDISKVDSHFRQSISCMDSFIEGTTDEQEDCQDFVRKLSFDSSVDHYDLNRGDLTSPSEPDLSNFVLNITAVISEEIQEETTDLVETPSMEEHMEDDRKEDLVEVMEEDESRDIKCITDMLSNIEEATERETVDRMRKMTGIGETTEHIKEDNKRNLREWIARTEAETEQDFEYFADDWEYSTLDCLMQDREGLCQDEDMEDIDGDYSETDPEDVHNYISQITQLRDTHQKEEYVPEDEVWSGPAQCLCLCTVKTVILWTVRLLILLTLFTFFGAVRINESVFYPVTWSLLDRSTHIHLPRPYVCVTYTSKY